MSWGMGSVVGVRAERGQMAGGTPQGEDQGSQGHTGPGFCLVLHDYIAR